MNDRRLGGSLLLPRRALLAAPALLIGLNPLIAQQAATPRQTRGPYYPVARPADSDMDLTQVAGRQRRAEGEVIEVTGRVLGLRTGPLAGATVEIWQADAAGRYHHPRDPSGGADPNFQGFGAVRSDNAGRWLFRTIRPRFYGSGSWARTPHIHFRVLGAGRGELVTQMYFPGEAMNARDGLYRSLASDTARAALTARPEQGLMPRFVFDLVLG
ncbi:protocatechuate 3,4-dioxygenase [Phreatobacter sp.]|uniref:dioxygenase family protein n=1 Tax=Phreatobacter sp. TaxID=1966341 RepID=UPI003F703759